MDAEDKIFRPPPPCPYQPGTAQLHLSTEALSATIGLLRRAGRRESGVLWYGPRTATGDGNVSLVVAPRQTMSWGNYSVSAEALTEIVSRLPEGWKPLAQIHSHPGLNVEHSNYDDHMVSSKRALSLVFPNYGHCRAPFPADLGVHEWQNDYWHLLDPALAERRVVLTQGPVTIEDWRR